MSEHPEKLDLTSQDISEEKLQQLKQVVPEAFTEDGYIDFDKLKTTLGEHVDEQEERFGLQWPGKRDCFKVIQEPAKGTLQPAPEESEDWENTENLFIEGDNLEVLKLLQKSYYGKVKMIYIDPPYNTGNEFIYPDDYKENLNTYLAYTGQVNEEGYKFSTNTETEGRYHSNWLNMMYPRLFMARNLLKDDGVIFISIDDHEVANLKLACNEIFGEENLIGTLIWKKKYTGGKHARFYVAYHEYILVYSKSKQNIPELFIERPEEEKEKFTETDKYFNERGQYYIRPLKSNLASRPTLVYPIEMPDGSFLEHQWIVSKDTFEKLKNEGRVEFRKKKNGSYQVYKKYYEKDEGGKVKPPSIIEKYPNTEAKHELKELFDINEGRDNVFYTVKPVKLLKYLAEPICNNGDEIVLDFFSGVSTLAHSIIDLNQHDNGNRKFIMVQLPEPTDSESGAYKAGLQTVAEIGKERIRRVTKNIEEQQNRDDKNDQLFKEKETENIPRLDLGFRVFKLDQSNFKEWEGTAKDQPVEEQLKLNVDHVRSGSSEEQMLYEILLKSGYPLTVPINTLELANKKVFSIVDSTMLICLEDGLDEAVIVAMAEKKPYKVVVLDKGFNGQDELKTNAVQIMKSHGVEDFRTV